MKQNTKIKNFFMDNFTEYEKLRNGDLNSAAHHLRIDGLTKFEQLDFPTRKIEEWKYTNVASITNSGFRLVANSDESRLTGGSLEPYVIDEAKNNLLVFIDGFYSEKFSKHEQRTGITVTNLADVFRSDDQDSINMIGNLVIADEDAFTALNTAFIHDGAFIKIDNNTILDSPLQIVFVATGSDEPVSFHPRNIISIGKNSGITIIETYVSSGTGVFFSNIINEIHVGENSHLKLYKLQLEGDDAFHIAKTRVKQDGNSTFESMFFTTGGRLVRNDIASKLAGENAECTLNGIFLANGSQHVDNQTLVDHVEPHCKSAQNYRGILDGEATGVFDGGIHVRKHAQKTDANQANRNLILSNKAQMNSRPLLLIYADDVKCSHGATVGQLDSDQLFYLRSRGFTEENARTLLTYAFASDLLNGIHIESLRKKLENIILNWLPTSSRIAEVR